MLVGCRQKSSLSRQKHRKVRGRRLDDDLNRAVSILVQVHLYPFLVPEGRRDAVASVFALGALRPEDMGEMRVKEGKTTSTQVGKSQPFQEVR